MVNEKHFPVLIASIQQYLDINVSVSNETLIKALTEKIVYMLHYEMKKLMGLLYRIDVKENLVKNAFSQQNPKLIAPLLAQAIIDRELQKIVTRKQYKQK